MGATLGRVVPLLRRTPNLSKASRAGAQTARGCGLGRAWARWRGSRDVQLQGCDEDPAAAEARRRMHECVDSRRGGVEREPEHLEPARLCPGRLSGRHGPRDALRAQRGRRPTAGRLSSAARRPAKERAPQPARAGALRGTRLSASSGACRPLPEPDAQPEQPESWAGTPPARHPSPPSQAESTSSRSKWLASHRS